MSAEAPVAMDRLSRCLACGAKAKLPAGSAAKLSVAACPMCGLALASIEGCEGFCPFVSPRVDRDAAWGALAKERGFATDDREARLIEGRLLMAPYWVGAKGGADGVRSAADLRPVGLPPATAEQEVPRGLGIRQSTASGDAMGRLPEGVTALNASGVVVTLSPDGGNPEAALAALLQDPAGAAWRLVYYPVWALHYALCEKEQHHIVDAVSGRPVGPAHHVRWGRAATIGAAALAITWLVGLTLIGPFAALPAWLAGVAGLHFAIARGRRI